MRRCGQGEGRSIRHQWHVHLYLVMMPVFLLTFWSLFRLSIASNSVLQISTANVHFVSP